MLDPPQHLSAQIKTVFATAGIGLDDPLILRVRQMRALLDLIDQATGIGAETRQVHLPIFIDLQAL
jgi:hypothetical protein